jgi:glycosyltransferase involved in cell wall biosynthesis
MSAAPSPLRTLLLCSRPPWPAIGGDRLRTAHLLRALGRLGPVALVATLERSDDPDEIRRGLPGVERMWLQRPRGLPRVLRSASALAGGGSLQRAWYAETGARKAVVEAIREFQPQVLVAHLVRTLDWLPPREQSPPLLIDVQDALSLQYSEARGLARGWRGAAMALERGRIGVLERAALSRAEAVTFITNRDRDAVWDAAGSDAAPAPRCVVASAVVDLDRWPDTPPSPEPDIVGFAGNLRTASNVDMVLHLADVVLPRLRERLPGARLRILGIEADGAVRRLAGRPGIELRGPVDDMPSELRRCALTACPLRFGSGIQNKVLESLAGRVPAVVSRKVADALGDGAADVVTVAEPGIPFADALLGLLRDPGRRAALGVRGRAWVAERHSEDAALGPFLSTIRELAAGARPGAA